MQDSDWPQIFFVANQRQEFEWVVELVGRESHPRGCFANSCELSFAPILLLGLLRVARLTTPGSQVQGQELQGPL